MAIVKVVCLVLLLGSAYAKDALFKACKVQDFNCLKEIVEGFYQRSATGIPDYGVKPIDPIHIDTVDDQGAETVVTHFRNITITGLRNMKLTDFTLDTKAKTLRVKMTSNINIDADIGVEFTEASKTLSGTYTSKANTRQMINHRFEVTTDDTGAQFLAFRDDDVDCENIAEPEVKLGDALQKDLDTDPDALKRDEEYRRRKPEFAKKHICKIVKEAFKTYVDNIKNYFRVVPLTNIFSDFTQ